MKKKLLIIAGIIVAVILLFIAFLPTILKSLGVHPDYDGPTYTVEGGKALIVTTSHGVLSRPGETEGKATGVFASENVQTPLILQCTSAINDCGCVKGEPSLVKALREIGIKAMEVVALTGCPFSFHLRRDFLRWIWLHPINSGCGLTDCAAFRVDTVAWRVFADPTRINRLGHQLVARVRRDAQVVGLVVVAAV